MTGVILFVMLQCQSGEFPMSKGQLEWSIIPQISGLQSKVCNFGYDNDWWLHTWNYPFACNNSHKTTINNNVLLFWAKKEQKFISVHTQTFPPLVHSLYHTRLFTKKLRHWKQRSLPPCGRLFHFHNWFLLYEWVQIREGDCGDYFISGNVSWESPSKLLTHNQDDMSVLSKAVAQYL